jgi:hypothetical protein
MEKLNMAYEHTFLSKMSPRQCYDASLQFVNQNGFKIMRKREIAWLFQACKDIEGKSRMINVTCRAGAKTQVTVSCLTISSQPEVVEKDLVDSLAQGLEKTLNAA